MSHGLSFQRWFREQDHIIRLAEDRSGGGQFGCSSELSAGSVVPLESWEWMRGAVLAVMALNLESAERMQQRQCGASFQAHSRSQPFLQAGASSQWAAPP